MMTHKIKLKKAILFLTIFCMIGIYQAQDDTYKVELKNGKTFTGKLISENDLSMTFQTELGELVIQKENIVSSENLLDNHKNTDIIKENDIVTKIINDEDKISEFNQEGRWRTIYGAMSAGNTIYGTGIPYVLGMKSGNAAAGFQLIAFGATYYASYAYTANMDIPMGRSYMQYTGANLGFFSIIPVTSLIGIENWIEIDPDLKLSILYSMFSVPYGVITADRLYNKWELNNGQSYLISLGVYLGIINSIGLLEQTEWVDWAKKNPENFWRWTSSLTYSGAVMGGYLAKNLALKNPSISGGDVGFLNTSMSLGIFNSFLLGSLIDFDNYKTQTLVSMAGLNGFLFLGNHLNKKFGSMSQGQERIVLLGMASSYLVWIGCVLLGDIDYTSDAARVLDMASVTGGWYLSRKSLNSQTSAIRFNKKNPERLSLDIQPTLRLQDRNLISGVNLSLKF
tara:strand:+ start:74 stop:1432 length:1359 start_codon:yes stop_codon:yes gene_type:complete